MTQQPMAETPLYRWRVPVAGDVPDVPADMQNLAVDIEQTLTGSTARAYVSTKRTADGGAGANVSIPLVPQLSIASAPAGVYLTAVWASWKPGDVTGSPVDLSCLVGGSITHTMRMERTGTTYQHWATGLTMLVHAGGNLAVDWSLQAPLVGLVALAGSSAWLCRVSS